MRILSDNSVTKSDIDDMALAVDAKQNVQIKKLRFWIAASFVMNAAIAVVLYFL